MQYFDELRVLSLSIFPCTWTAHAHNWVTEPAVNHENQNGDRLLGMIGYLLAIDLHSQTRTSMHYVLETAKQRILELFFSFPCRFSLSEHENLSYFLVHNSAVFHSKCCLLKPFWTKTSISDLSCKTSTNIFSPKFHRGEGVRLIRECGLYAEEYGNSS